MGRSLEIKTVSITVKFGNRLSLGIFADSHKRRGGFGGWAYQEIQRTPALKLIRLGVRIRRELPIIQYLLKRAASFS